TSLFDYGPGQSTATFTVPNFPLNNISLADLPADVVAHAAALVASAGITDPVTAQRAELDYLASGDPSVIIAAATINQQVTGSSAPTVTRSTPRAGALGGTAMQTQVSEATSGPTHVPFTAYLTAASTTDTIVDYTVVSTLAGDFGAAAFGGTLPSGTVTITAG